MAAAIGLQAFHDDAAERSKTGKVTAKRSHGKQVELQGVREEERAAQVLRANFICMSPQAKLEVDNGMPIYSFEVQWNCPCPLPQRDGVIKLERDPTRRYEAERSAKGLSVWNETRGPDGTVPRSTAMESLSRENIYYGDILTCDPLTYAVLAAKESAPKTGEGAHPKGQVLMPGTRRKTVAQARSINSGTFETGTETSCLMLAPSKR